MTMEIALNNLTFSPKNVRTVNAGSNADKLLISTIAAQGLLQNLVVKKSTDKTNSYEVVAGGRRLAALKHLVKNKQLKRNHPVECLVVESDDVTAVSLTENVAREDMHSADKCLAYQTMFVDDKASVKDIACLFGTTQNDVKRYLKLASVSPLIMTAFKADKLSIDCVKAFTVSDSHEEQDSCFKHFSSRYFDSHSIRDFLLSESLLSDHKLAKLIGLKAYKKAGGKTSTDLFSNETHLLDMPILISLVEELLNVEKEALLSNEWKWVEILTNGSPNIFDYNLVDPTPVNVPKKIDNEIEKLSARYKELEEMNSEEWSDELETEYDDIESRLEDLDVERDKYGVYSLKDKSYSGCIVFVNPKGELAVQKGLAKAADFKKQLVSESKAEQESNETDRVEPETVDSKAYAASLNVDIKIYKQQIIKSKIASSPIFANDLLIFTLSRKLLLNEYFNSSLNISCESTDGKPKLDDLADTTAGQAFADLYRKLELSYLREESKIESFAMFQKLKRSQKDKIMSYVTGSVFTLSDNQTDEMIVGQLDIDFASNWRPTYDNFFSRLVRINLLDLGKEWRGDKWFSDNLNNKKKDIAQALHDVFHSDEELTDPLMVIRSEWLPDGFKTN